MSPNPYRLRSNCQIRMKLSAILLFGPWVTTASLIKRGDLAPAATTTDSAAVASATQISAQNATSTNLAPYNGNSSAYHLGYRSDDFQRPFAKYWNPTIAPLFDEFLNGLVASPWANALAYTAHEAHDYFTRPGYDTLENGFTITENGTVVIAVRSEIPQMTGESFDWWFAWHQTEAARYKLWNPVAHAYVWRLPERVDATRSYRDRWINTTSYVAEYVGEESSKISIGFIQPETLGFNQTSWAALGIETIVMGHILIGKHTTSEWDGESYLMHQVRRLPNGNREMRSRFWVAKNNHGTAQIGHDLAVHCNIEMTRGSRTALHLSGVVQADILHL
ncbi:hypothetical protein PRZ48_015201 [Zasmidium cellare]|uniref:DAPG hydrolase PhiG domain-containing protein n=1 Tax=Zasmidium cellare TaxID=395010 RepID=A0ABR0DXZ7_ZASCE|nr:hypothetical protein PRZ48_015201 [Zasmidium cellare]